VDFPTLDLSGFAAIHWSTVAAFVLETEAARMPSQIEAIMIRMRSLPDQRPDQSTTMVRVRQSEASM